MTTKLNFRFALLCIQLTISLTGFERSHIALAQGLPNSVEQDAVTTTGRSESVPLKPPPRSEEADFSAGIDTVEDLRASKGSQRSRTRSLQRATTTTSGLEDLPGTAQRSLNPAAINAMTLDSVVSATGILTADDALGKSGLSPNMGAQLQLLTGSLGMMLMIRAGAPPHYNRPTAPKPGYVKSKTSKGQGFFNGLLSAEDKFTKIVPDETDPTKLKVLGLHPADKAGMALPTDHPGYIHSKQLTVNLQDISTQLGDGGDMVMQGYNPDTKELTLGFKPGKGPPGFTGHFSITLKPPPGVTAVPRKILRPWDKKSASDVVRQLVTQNNIPEEDLMLMSDIEIPLSYRDSGAQTEPLKPAMVLARTPKTLEELRAMLNQESDPNKTELLKKIKGITEFSAALKAVGPDALKAIYDAHGKIITGDIDGLAVAMPAGMSPEYNQTFTTFDKTGKPDQKQIDSLLASAEKLFNDLKNKATAKAENDRTIADTYLIEHTFEKLAGDKFLQQRAGVITPAEFLFNQFANSSINRGISSTDWISDTASNHNVTNLFQHGYDMRSPYKVEADGPWLMVTKTGQILRGETHAQLVSVLMADNGKLLQDTYFDVNPSINMKPFAETGIGWGDVVRKQVEFRHPVPTVTRANMEEEFARRGLQGSDGLSDADDGSVGSPRSPRSSAASEDGSPESVQSPRSPAASEDGSPEFGQSPSSKLPAHSNPEGIGIRGRSSILDQAPLLHKPLFRRPPLRGAQPLRTSPEELRVEEY